MYPPVPGLFSPQILRLCSLANESVFRFSDWKQFPAELKPRQKRKIRTARPNLKAAKLSGTPEDILSKFEVYSWTV